jgi:CRP/FNR family transcriptional regulator, cyclic AMP receptor protein
MARNDTKLEHLSRVPLFSALSKKELQHLGRTSDEVTVAEGKVLCQEGKTGHEFFLILDGEAAVKKGKKTVAKLGAGQYFGEMSLLDSGPRSATVEASSDMEVLVIGQREFAGMLEQLPGVARKLLSAMAARLRDADAKAFSH